jgi:hypothetical protein
MISISNEDKSYIAGLFDGEGCVHIGGRRHNSSYNLEVSIANTNLEVLEWIKSIFGGYVKTHKKAKEYHTQCYSWRVVSKQASEFLECIYSYMRIKKPQADAAITFQSIKCPVGAKQSPILKEVERIIYENLHMDHHKGG